jgi:hypothetical protein
MWTERRGAFVAPFVDEELEWDFRLPRVASINASGHKYGLVYPGVGWIVWRDAAALPEDLIFRVNYHGDNMPTFALNFSRGGPRRFASSSSAVFGHDIADLLVSDLERQLPRLQKQATPLHEGAEATGFHH